jgi:hypothetical protein
LCGNYIKAAFESEYIRLQLTLLEIQGSKIRMYGDAGDDMFAWSSTDVEIERVGADVLISEATGFPTRAKMEELDLSWIADKLGI